MVIPVHVLLQVALADPSGRAHYTFVRYSKAYNTLIRDNVGVRAKVADTLSFPINVPCPFCNGGVNTTGVMRNLFTADDPIIPHTIGDDPFECTRCRYTAYFLHGRLRGKTIHELPPIFKHSIVSIPHMLRSKLCLMMGAFGKRVETFEEIVALTKEARKIKRATDWKPEFWLPVLDGMEDSWGWMSKQQNLGGW